MEEVVTLRFSQTLAEIAPGFVFVGCRVDRGHIVAESPRGGPARRMERLIMIFRNTLRDRPCPQGMLFHFGILRAAVGTYRGQEGS